MVISLVLMLLTVGGQAGQASQATAEGRLHFTPAAGWTTKPTTSMMRIAEFVLPKAEGDTEDASLIVYYFGGTGGSVQANIDRWLGQIAQPDGRPTKQVATVTERRVNGMAMTHVDATGTLVAEVSPGSAERHNKPGFRLRAAVIQSSNGPYFVRVVGPAKTVARWNTEIDAFLGSIRYGK
jgi:hypothetical protein